MSETMIERVAKAIYEKRNGPGCIPWGIRPKAHKEPYLFDARSAIEAMRFPVGASSVPGGLAIEESMFGSEDTVFHGAAKSFNAILDAALSPASNGEK